MIDLSKLRQNVNSMPNKRSSTDGITIIIVKWAFETIGNRFLDLINLTTKRYSP